VFKGYSFIGEDHYKILYGGKKMKRNPINKKVWVVFLVVFFIGIGISTMIHGLWIEKNDINIQIGDHGSRDDNDTTPPVTTISFDPPVPNGLNDWYVSNVLVTLNATDNGSGVWRTYCSVSPGGIYTEPVLVSQDGVYNITFYSVDYAGNTEAMKSALLKIDHTKPTVMLTYNVTGNILCGWNVIMIGYATDYMSGMNRVEFYYNDFLQETIIGPGPEYIWSCISPQITVRGLIRHLEITDEYVKFYVVIVRINNLWDLWINSMTKWAIFYDNAGNNIWDQIEDPCHLTVIEPGFYLFQNMTLPNNYTGNIGRFFIFATFYNINI